MHTQLIIAPRHPYSRVLAGLTWVSPNASLDRLDVNALERWTGPRAEKPVVPFDSLLHPDWYTQEKHWHPWVPHSRGGLWWHDNTCRPLDDQAGAKQELLAMVNILGGIYRHIRPEGPRPDNMYLIKDLNLSLPGPRDHARRFMLSTSGYIRWLRAHRPDDMERFLKEHLSSKDVERMLGWGLDQPGGVGVILDLIRDRREMNIGLYLRHNIPVYYPWTLSAAADSTLYHLSPTYLSSPDDSHEKPSIPSPNVDFFFQPLLPGQRGLAVTAQKLPALTHQVLDFQGWKSRSISGKAARCCFQLCYFEEHLDEGLNPPYLRVYHRFRSNNSQEPKYLAGDPVDVCIREKWKFDHAPPAGQFYDASTQQLKTAEPTPTQTPPPVHPSWGLMIPPLPDKDTGHQGPAQSEADDPAAIYLARMKDVVVQVDFGNFGGLDADIRTFVLRMPDRLHVPHDGGLWSS